MKQNIRLIFPLLFVACLSCRASRILFPEFDQGDTNWEMTESQHFYIYLRPSSEASRDLEFISSYLDHMFMRCSEILDVKYQNRLKCYIYDSMQELQEKQHTKSGGFALPEFETICYFYPKRQGYMSWDGFRHEIVHVLVYWTVGTRKLRFLGEGIAVAIQKYSWPAGYDRLWVHAVSSDLLKNDRLFSISQLASNEFFENIHDLQLSEQDTIHHLYDQCGSLVRYLFDQYSIEKFKIFYSKADEDNYRTIFQYTYNRSIDDFEKEWHEFLRNH